MNLEQARFNMIEQQIRPWNVLDVSILSLLSAVRREDFVPAQHQSLAFVDMEIPLEGGRKLLAPRVEARIVQELQVHKHERVLLVGAATGYLAALLGHKAQRVLAFGDPLDAGRHAAALAIGPPCEILLDPDRRHARGQGPQAAVLRGRRGRGHAHRHRSPGSRTRPRQRRLTFGASAEKGLPTLAAPFCFRSHS